MPSAFNIDIADLRKHHSMRKKCPVWPLKMSIPDHRRRPHQGRAEQSSQLRDHSTRNYPGQKRLSSRPAWRNCHFLISYQPDACGNLYLRAWLALSSDPLSQGPICRAVPLIAKAWDRLKVNCTNQRVMKSWLIWSRKPSSTLGSLLKNQWACDQEIDQCCISNIKKYLGDEDLLKIPWSKPRPSRWQIFMEISFPRTDTFIDHLQQPEQQKTWPSSLLS